MENEKNLDLEKNSQEEVLEIEKNEETVKSEEIVENQVTETKKSESNFLDKLFKTDNLFEKIAVGLMSIITLGFIYSFFKLVKIDSIDDVLGYASSQSFIRFFVVLLVVVIILMIVKLFYNKKDIKTFLTKGNIFMSAGTLSVLFGTLYINKLISLISASKKAMSGGNILGNLMDLGSELLSFSSIDIEKFVKSKVRVTTFLHFVGVLLFIVAIILILKTFSKNEKITKLADTVSSKVDGVVNSAKNIDKQEVENTVKETTEKTISFIQKFKKQIILGVVGIAVVLVGFFGFKIVKEMNTPDAVVSLKNIEIEAKFKGANEKGKVDVMVKGHPKISEVRKGKNYGEIYNFVSEYEVVVDKESNLKNGDEIKVTVKYKAPQDFKLKYDKKEIEKTFKVENLLEVVTSINDISKNHLERIEKKISEKISKNIYRDYKDLKIEKIKSFEKELDENDDFSYNQYNILNMYKISYQTKKIFSDEYETKESLVLYQVSNFNKKGESLTFDVYNERTRDYSDSEIEDTTNRLKIEGYKEIK